MSINNEPRFYAACLQTDTVSVEKRQEISPNLERACQLIDYTVGFALSALTPVKLVAFGESFLQGFLRDQKRGTTETYRRISIPIPGEETEQLAKKAKEHQLYVAGAALELIDEWPDRNFNCAFLIDPQGQLIYKRRKVQTWDPKELSCSPHDVLDKWNEELFPVADTEIGKIGMYICYERMFPEVARNLVLNGAEILINPTAWMDPWGVEPTDWWTVINRARAIENMAYVIAPNVGSDMQRFPSMSRPGKSMLVDWEGKILAQGERGEAIIGTLLDVGLLRQLRRTNLIWNMPAQLRTEAYQGYRRPNYPANLWLERPGETEELAEITRKQIKKVYGG